MKESSEKVAPTRPELHKIQHESIQVVDEGIGLENYLIRNVATLRKLSINVCLRKIKILCRHSLNFYHDELDPAEHTKERWSGERRAEFRRSARRQQFIIKVSSGRFYNQQEEVLNQTSLRVIDRFVFNLAVDNTGQKADNKHTGSMIFTDPFFLLVSKADKPLGDDTFQNQSVKLIR